MTMVAERKNSIPFLDDRGQGALEFLLLLPMCLGVVMLMIRVNTVIQISIVDQKYAREQALFVAGNAADYPLRPGVVETLAGTGASMSNQLVMGVSENAPTGTGDADSESFNTQASTFVIGRASNRLGSDAQGEVNKRSKIRVRNTVNLCLPLLSTNNTPIFNQNTGIYQMPENPSQYKFCTTEIPMAGS